MQEESDSLSQRTLETLVDQVALLMAQFERRCAWLEQQQQSAAQALQETVTQVPLTVRQSADHALHALPHQILERVREGLDRPVADCQQRLHAASAEAGEGIRALAQQAAGLQRLHRWLMWKVGAVAAVSLALLLAGGAWLVAHYAQVVREHRLSAQMQQALQRADIVVCGDGELCARTETKGPRYGERGEYARVAPRR